MTNRTENKKLEEIYVVLSDLRYLMHKDDNSLEDFEEIAKNYWQRISEAAEYARELLPEEVVERLDEK